MAQMTWRTSEELLERVRHQAQQHGHSLNEWVTMVLAAASDPNSAGTEGERVRERLRRAGLLDEPVDGHRSGPGRARLAEARASAGRGTPLSELVIKGRR